ncbi:CDH-cyt domain containing protein [Pyrenophora tritici-repentis]|nr:CDH-cyt domain containing protein [Pyrenophora tritici-repentis]
MRYAQILGSAGAFAGYVLAQGEAQSTVVYDAETKITYSSYTDPGTGMTFGVALPKNVTDPYDAIIRITAPFANRWVGFSWGGDMVWNPLSVSWPNGQSGTISARFAL